MSNPSESQSSPKRKEILYMDAHYKDPWLPPPPIHTYHVPCRFGVSGLIAITSLMAVIFGILQRYDVHPLAYVFLGIMVLFTCIAQMRFGKTPRLASCIMGAILLSVIVQGIEVYDQIGTHRSYYFRNPLFSLKLFLWALFCGCLLGYITGTVTAACFMFMEMFDSVFHRKAKPQQAVQWDGPESEQRLEKSYESGIEIIGEADHPAAKHSGI